MTLNAIRLLTLVLAALSLTMESAHVLEMPQKLEYGAAMYTTVNATLYRYFAIVGGSYQVAAIACAAVLAYLVRLEPRAYRWTLAGLILLVVAFAVWGAVVAPVNSTIDAAFESDATTVPQLWMQLRTRWEYGHAAGFVLQLAGFAALVRSLIVAIPLPLHRKTA